MAEPEIAFRVREHDEPALEVCVNFGVFAGRDATAAEIEELARRLAPEMRAFSIVAEHRHEFASGAEASLHQVRIEVERDAAGPDADALCERIVALADGWAAACFADRRAEVSEL